MILTDANILIYAYNADSPFHQECRDWLSEQLSSPQPCAFSWQTITAFLRITTSTRIFPDPFTLEEARGIVSEWLALPNVRILIPTERHWPIFERLLIDSRIVGAKMMDAHLAALAMEHGVTFATTDRDFAGFKGLKTLNPLDNEAR